MVVLERQLVPFASGPVAPIAPGGASATVTAILRREAGGLRYRLSLAVPGIVVPEAADGPPGRRDGLWRQTCAELFVARPGRPEYLEWNLSPSGHWNLYSFDGYREGGREAALDGASPPTISPLEPGLVVEGFLPLAPFGLAATSLELAACAVVETSGGNLSWWAPAHAGARPDFHDRRGFTLRLPPPAPATADIPEES